MSRDIIKVANERGKEAGTVVWVLQESGYDPGCKGEEIVGA
jgi:hypothetical protein